MAESMKIVFVSNYFNHHQSALSAALYRETKGEYFFIATEEMPRERRALGYGQEPVPEYVLYTYTTEEEYIRCQRLINEADVVIIGSAPEQLLRERKKAGKIIFRYSERPLKKGFQAIKYFPRLLRWHSCNPMNRPIYMLCSSAYTAFDYAKFGLFRDRSYKWGYFPEAKRYDIEKLFSLKRNKTQKILWVGRLLEWKHADHVVLVAERLKQAGYHFEVDFIGVGELEQQIAEMICERDLEDCVRLLGSMKPEEVRQHMECANIYLFTSDRQEGWGAVLNESMNSGCAVVASHAIGSVPFLIRDGENGLVYESGNIDMLCEKVKYLLERPEEQKKLGCAAYQTITELWSAENAAARLNELLIEVLSGEKNPELFADGPCSKAEILAEDWFQRER